MEDDDPRRLSGPSYPDEPVRRRIDAVVDKGLDHTDGARWLLGLFRENGRATSLIMIRSYVFLVATLLSWALVRTAQLGEVEFFGVTIDNAAIVEIAVSMMAVFFFYRFHAYFAYDNALWWAVDRLYERRFPDLHSEDVHRLAEPQSITAVGEALIALRFGDRGNKSKLVLAHRLVSSPLLFIGALLAPIIAIVWLLVGMVSDSPFGRAGTIVWAIVLGLIVLGALITIAISWMDRYEPRGQPKQQWHSRKGSARPGSS